MQKLSPSDTQDVINIINHNHKKLPEEEIEVDIN